MDNCKTIQLNPVENYKLSYIESFPYAQRESRTLYMRILTPNRAGMPPIPDSYNENDKDPAFGVGKPPAVIQRPPVSPKPAVIFVGGTGFAGSVGYKGLTNLCDIAREGIVLASIDYRGAKRDNTRYPDCVQDVKEAVRFLRANAGKYGIDPDRIALMGTSSGGWAVTMAGITDGEPEFDIGDNLEYSSSVCAVMDCFGPMDFTTIVEDRIAIGRKMGQYTHELYSLFRNDVVANPGLIPQTSVIDRIRRDKNIPPMFVIHGDADHTVPHKQSVRLYEKLMQEGKDAAFITVAGAGHEDIWFPDVVDEMRAFFKKVFNL